MTDIYDTLIIGGGAAGLMAGCALSRAGRHVVVLEKQDRVGRKLLSTGNGRCNLSNLNAAPARYHGSRQAVRMALRAWPPKKVLEIFEGLGIPCSADDEGRVYPLSRQAASVLDALRLGCDENGAETLTGFAVTGLSRDGRAFTAVAADGRRVRGRTALVCAGGLAAPKLGACGDGHRLLEALGHAVTPRFPAIAALKTPPEAVRGLKGLRAEVSLALLVDGQAVREEAGELLLTDYGLSGIAAMQLARSANEALRAGRRCAARIDFAPGRDARALLEARRDSLPRRAMEDFLNGIVPRRLGQTLARAAGLELSLPAARLDAARLGALAAVLSGWTLPVTGTQGFDQAQVTAGGASLKDFDLRTLESLRVPGLYAAGEVLDVDGDCGGYNLHWAWASALTAAAGIDSGLSEGRA